MNRLTEDKRMLEYGLMLPYSNIFVSLRPVMAVLEREHMILLIALLIQEMIHGMC